MRAPSSRPTGTTVGTVLLALSVGLVLTMTVASVSLAGQQFSRVVDRRDVARNLAEAAIAEGLAQVQQSEHYGEAGAAFRDISVAAPEAKSFGFLTFNRQNAQSQQMSYSSNFFFSNRPQMGASQRVVPRSCVHLVGLGVSGPVRHQVEALIFKPPFSEGVCCAGRVEASGMLLGGLRDPAGFAGSYATTPHTQKMAGHIFANGQGRAVVQLKNDSDVRGNVGSAGGISIVQSKVQGEVHPFAFPRQIPRLDLSSIVTVMSQVEGSWNWTGAGKSPVTGGGNGSAQRPWSGYRVIDGPLVHQGDLYLNGGAIYVKGDVDVRGAIRGRGCIVSTGEARVQGGAPFESNANLSLCAQGNVTLTGGGSDNSFFQGMIYSEGDIKANDISVMGALVAPGQSSQGQVSQGNVYLDNVNVYPCPRQVSVTVGSPPKPMGLRQHPPLDEFSDGSYDAMTVRVDVSEKRDGLQLYDAYLYYAKNYSYRESPGGRGWTGNAAYFHQTQPNYQSHGPETEPIVLNGLEFDELLYQLNEIVAKITREGSGNSATRTYLADPRSLTPAHNPRPNDSYAPANIMETIRTKVGEVSKGGSSSKVLDFNLTRRLPAQEQYRILLMRDLSP
jgi:hypothetical protein